MSDERLGAKKELTQSELEDWIADNESIIGPIKAIECAEDGTVGTFDIDGEPVTKRARVILDPAPCPAPTQKAFGGRAYVSNNCVKVTICR